MIGLEESIEQTKACIDMLVDNRFLEALDITKQQVDHSIYHAHTYSLLLWLKAYLSLEMPEIEIAQKASEKALEFCEKIRPQTLRDNFFIKFFVKTNYEEFTDEEIHAELCRTEEIVFSTLMEFFLDQSLFVLMKVSYRLRYCYLMYKTFSKMIDNKEWNSELSYENFKSGINLGLGVFNLMFSMLPERIMSLLSMVGFKGCRQQGLKMLNESSHATKTWRSFGAQMMLAAYETYFDQLFHAHTTETPNTAKHVQEALSKNPQSIWFMAFKGRIMLIEHDVDKALETFERSLKLEHLEVKQLINLYVWETMWCYAIKSNWKKAYEHCCYLRDNCLWSTCTFLYLEGVFLTMSLEFELVKDESFKNSKEYIKTRKQIHELFEEVPRRVKRYAGRRIPMEKYACEKVITYQKDGILIAPVYEMFLILNIIIFIEGKEQYVTPIMEHVNKCLQYFKLDQDKERYMLLCLVKGVCHRLLAQFSEAESYLLKVAAKDSYSKPDRHLASFAALEMGIVKMSQNQFDEARSWYLRNKNNQMNNHALELVVHFRGYTAYSELRRLRDTISDENKNTSPQEILSLASTVTSD